MEKPIHIVFTTIFVPYVLQSLVDNLKRFGRLEHCKVWLVADRKTPRKAYSLSRAATGQGLETACLSIEDQDKWGPRYVPEFYDRVPYDNETRRNIGYLRALEEGCAVVISIDDDNFPVSDDFVGVHSHTGSRWRESVLHEETGFHNVCEYLKIAPPRSIFPRGFPFNLRGVTNSPQNVAASVNAKIGVTAGLWLHDPDVDATTWLNGKVFAEAYNGPDVSVLAQDTWTPINTQNTSVVRELIVAFLCVPMGQEVPGGRIQRYGDVWGGYFLQAILQGTDYHVAFGRPLVEHRRNPHHYVDDLRHEFWGMILTDWLVQLLRTEFKPSGDSISGRVEHLADFLCSEGIRNLPNWAPEALKLFLQATGDNLRAWASACKRFT